ncbi:hypothetical protein [Rhizocola hellebori]|nr:hypothetical protein [Rhizocola hellebori]
MPMAEDTIRSWTSATLTAELVQLSIFASRLKDQVVGSDLHRRAQQVGVASGGYEPRADEIVAAYGNPRLRQRADGWWDPARERYIEHYAPIRKEERLQRLVRARLAGPVAKEQDETLSTLFVHPNGVDILAEYRSGAAAGLRCASWHVDAADRAMIELFGRLTAPGNTDIWHYPLLVVGGINASGLGGVPGFPEYVAALGQVLGSDSLDLWLGAAGITVLALGIFFTGPAAALILATADLALAGMGVGVAYLRDREQDLTAQATSLRPEEARLAEPSTYAGTLFAGAAALLSGMAFFRAAKEFRAVAQARPTTVARALAQPEAAIPDWVRVRSRPMVEKVETVHQSAGASLPHGFGTRSNAFDPATYRAVQRGTEGLPPSAARSTGQPAPAAEAASATTRPVAETVPTGNRPAADIPPNAPREVSVTAPADAPPTPETARGISRHDSGRSTGSGTDEPVLRSDDPRATGERGTGALTREQLQAHRAELRAALQAKIEAKEAEILSEEIRLARTKREVSEVNHQRRVAYEAGRIDEVRALRPKLEELKDEVDSFTIDALKNDLKRFKKQLGISAEEHYLRITAAGASHANSVLVRAGPASPLFRPSTTGTYSVEHIWPRSQIFLEPAFLGLRREQQVALMAYQPNLIKIPAAANSARGNRAYRTVSAEFTRTFLSSPAAQAELARMEELMKADMINLMKNPHLIPL